MAERAQYLGTGKRKTSVARVILRPGDGATWINGRSLEDYFPRGLHRTYVVAPLKTAGVEGQYDLRVRVHGGGRMLGGPQWLAGTSGRTASAASSALI